MALFSDLLTWLRGEPPADDPDAREAFALRLGAWLRASGAALTYDPERFAFLGEGGRVAFLDNHWATFRLLDPEEQESFLMELTAHVGRLAGEPERPADDWEEAALHLRPRIRQRHHLDLVRHQAARQAGDAVQVEGVTFPLVGTLVIHLVYDLPTTIVGVSGSQLEGWGVSPDHALAQAIVNLLDTTDVPFVSYEEGVFVAEVGDCYDSARMLLSEVVEVLPVEGRHVALPANRDLLLITGEHDYAGLQRLLEAATAAMDLPRLDTVAPLVLDEGAWQPWLPPPEHPHHAEWAELALRDRASAYATTRERLDEEHAESGTDVFIAGYNAMVVDGVPRSWATWAPVVGWLPQVELVAVALGEEPDEGLLLVPWEAVQAEAGAHLHPIDGLAPPYFAYEGLPPADVLERLAAHDVSGEPA